MICLEGLKARKDFKLADKVFGYILGSYIASISNVTVCYVEQEGIIFIMVLLIGGGGVVITLPESGVCLEYIC
jgi:hypothetical protein